MTSAENGEILFVVDVTSFTEKGFVGTTAYENEKVAIDFDPQGEGIFLTSEMAKRIGAKRGDEVFVIIEDKSHTLARMAVAALGKKVRVSDDKAYHAVGREGGAVLRIRKP